MTTQGPLEEITAHDIGGGCFAIAGVIALSVALLGNGFPALAYVGAGLITAGGGYIGGSLCYRHRAAKTDKTALTLTIPPLPVKPANENTPLLP